jgi:hypothetical protein
MSREDELRRWLLLIYRVPQEPAARRTYVWRQLKQLGAHYLQQAAAIVPDEDELRASLEALSQKIRDFGGEVSLLTTVSPDLTWQQGTIERFNQARDAEYAEIVENIERFEDEIRRERSKGRFTFAQLEDVEADWEKLQRWYDRIQGRDFFEAPARLTAQADLERGRSTLESFTAEVYAHEETDGDATTKPG